MALNFNGNTPKKIFYNTAKVSKVIYNNVVVWMSKVLTTITGNTPIRLVNATEDNLVEATIQGVCTQASTPTPSVPVDIECNNGIIKVSKNLCNVISENIVVGKYINNSGVVTADVNNFYYSLYIPVISGETYTMKTSQSIWYFNIEEYDSSQTFLRRDLWGATNTPAGTSTTFTVGADCYYIRFGSNMTKSSLTEENVLSVDWMLTKGSTAETYRPYNSWWIDGTQEVLTLNGKNQFNVSVAPVEQGNISSTTGENTNSTTRCRTKERFPVSPNTQYTLSCVIENFTPGSSKGVFVYQYLSDGTWTTSGWKDPSGFTFTTNALTESIRVVFAYVNAGSPTTPEMISNVQLEYGDTATSYEAYITPQTATVENLFGYGSYNDTQDIISGNIKQNMGVIIFNGSDDENWSRLGTNIFQIAIAGKVKGKIPMLSSQYSYTSLNSSNISSGEFGCAASTRTTYFKNNLYDTVDDFKNYLHTQYANGTPVYVVYPLETTISKSVTTQTLTANEGTNVISSNKGVRDIEVKYYRTQ